MDTLLQRAQRLESEGVFLGGPLSLFEAVGRNILETLRQEGLTADSRVLDIGCGCLRGGYWLIEFLDRDCYFGIEPNREMLEAGRRILLEPDAEASKNPRFDSNADFDFGVFEVKFDFYVARSIWTHASKVQIRKMLDEFIKTSSPNAVFITSFLAPTLLKRDYKGEEWVGKSHESDTPGLVRHSLRWIRSECSKRDLIAEETADQDHNAGDQLWLRIRRVAAPT